MRHGSSSFAATRSRHRRGAPLSLAFALALSSLLFVDDALASERAPSRTEPGLSSHDEEPLLARRRARQRRARQRPAAPTPPTQRTPPEAPPEAASEATRRGPTRVEFDERLLQGQTNKANAIYLFQRRESALRSLVKKREHFHAEIDEALE